ncbi:MAG: hypothetical protein AAGC93_24025 [Cyanobacteria bacterium P01_F01_bin.53]
MHEASPEEVATDILSFYLRAIEKEWCKDIEHKVLSCTANPVEQSHSQYRHYPTLDFGEFNAAQRF